MPPTPKPPTPPDHSKEVGKVVKKILKVLGICIGLVVLAALGYCLLAFDVWHVHFGYEQAAARYKAAGMPWTASELTGPKIPPEKNAGPRLFALAAKFENLKPHYPDQRDVLLDRDAALELQAYLEPRNKLLDEYKPLANLDIDWDKDWDKGAEILFPEFGRLKEMTKGFAARMLLRSIRGDVKGSLDDFRSGIRLTQQTGKVKMLLGSLVEMAQRSNLLQACRRSASIHVDQPEVLSAYAEAMRELEPSVSIAESLRPDAYMGLTTLRNVSWRDLTAIVSTEYWAGQEPLDSKQLVRDGDPSSFINRSFAVPFLNYWAEFGEGVKSKGDSLDSLEAIAKKLDLKADSPRGFSDKILAILAPRLKGSIAAARRDQANLRANLAVFQIAALRAKKGSVTQAEVNALLPEDPFSHLPMKASVKGKVVKVWSVGDDEVDNGGVTKAESYGGPFDYVAELPFRSPLSETRATGMPPALSGQGFPPPGLDPAKGQGPAPIRQSSH